MQAGFPNPAADGHLNFEAWITLQMSHPMAQAGPMKNGLCCIKNPVVETPKHPEHAPEIAGSTVIGALARVSKDSGLPLLWFECHDVPGRRLMEPEHCSRQATDIQPSLGA
jgi:hypothetical protein